jgi:hypothetical protein
MADLILQPKSHKIPSTIVLKGPKDVFKEVIFKDGFINRFFNCLVCYITKKSAVNTRDSPPKQRLACGSVLEYNCGYFGRH